MSLLLSEKAASPFLSHTLSREGEAEASPLSREKKVDFDVAVNLVPSSSSSFFSHLSATAKKEPPQNAKKKKRRKRRRMAGPSVPLSSLLPVPTPTRKRFTGRCTLEKHQMKKEEKKKGGGEMLFATQGEIKLRQAGRQQQQRNVFFWFVVVLLLPQSPSSGVGWSEQKVPLFCPKNGSPYSSDLDTG